MGAADSGTSYEGDEGPVVMSTAETTISAVTLVLIQKLRVTADQKVREREVHLAALRNLLFPPEIPSDEEADGQSESETRAEMISSSFAVVQGPTMKQVQSAVEALRESSLGVVEAVQSWRQAQGDPDCVSTRGRGLEAKERSIDGVPESALQAQDEDTSISKLQLGDDTQEQGRLPAVPSSQAISTTTSRTTRSEHQDQLPTYLWSGNLKALAQEDPTLGNTGFAGGPNEFAMEPEGIDAGDNHGCVPGEGEEVVSAVDTTTTGSTSPNDSAAESILGSGPPREEGINYLVKMTWDIDFVGAPGSVLAEMLPPDTKLFRNPFVLAHNLDDTLLAGFPRKRSRASGDGGRERLRGRERGSLSAERGSGADEGQAQGRGRIDPGRVRRAVEVILSAETEAIPDDDDHGAAGCHVANKVLPDSIKPIEEDTTESSLGGKGRDGDAEGSVDVLHGQSKAGAGPCQEKPYGDNGDLRPVQSSRIESSRQRFVR